MKIVSSMALAVVVASFVAILNGCATDTTGDESEQGSDALSSSANGAVNRPDPSTGGTPDPSTGGTPDPSTGGKPSASTGGKPSVSSAAPANTIMKVTPPLHCAKANTSGSVTSNGCDLGEVCCASPVYGAPPICIKGKTCPALP